MRQEGIAKRYALAVFHSANRTQQARIVESELSMFTEILKSSPKFKEFVCNPTVTQVDKLKFINGFFEHKLSLLTLEFLRVVFEKRREKALQEIYQEFVKLRRAEENVIFTKVYSANILSDAEKNEIFDKVEHSTGKKMEVEYLVDSKLVAGIKIDHNHAVLDGSVQNNLRRMREKLLVSVQKGSEG